jgi:hypothetical protein
MKELATPARKTKSWQGAGADGTGKESGANGTSKARLLRTQQVEEAVDPGPLELKR